MNLTSFQHWETVKHFKWRRQNLLFTRRINQRENHKFIVWQIIYRNITPSCTSVSSYLQSPDNVRVSVCAIILNLISSKFRCSLSSFSILNKNCLQTNCNVFSMLVLPCNDFNFWMKSGLHILALQMNNFVHMCILNYGVYINTRHKAFRWTTVPSWTNFWSIH